MTLDEYLLTGFSVFIGAAAAFILTEVWDTRKRKAAQYKAGIYSQFLLATQYSALAAYRKQNLKPHIDHSEREFIVKPTPPNAPNELIDFSSLSFLLDQKYRHIRQGRFKSILLTLQTVQECYRTLLEAINQRSIVHLRYQEALRQIELARAARCEQLTEDDLKIEPYASQLKELTDNIYQFIDEYIRDIVAQNIELGEAIRYGLVEKPLEFKWLPEDDPLEAKNTNEEQS